MARVKDKGLNPQQEEFCQQYVKDYNGKQAAIRAKYSEKTAESQASRLLRIVKVQQRIEELNREIHNKIGISKEKICKELALIGFSSIDEHLTIDDGGTIRAKSFKEMPLGAARAIKKIKEKRTIKSCQGTKDKPSEDVILESTFEFELHDKQTALINLGKELGMFRERHELSGKDGSPLIVEIIKFATENKNTK
jgi:phage terminase small subunit